MSRKIKNDNSKIESVPVNVELTPDKFEIMGIDSEQSEVIMRPNMTFAQDAWRRLKKNKVATVALVILLLVILFVIVVPFIFPDYTTQMRGKQYKDLGPTKEFWFGTDTLGRDLFARVAYGGRISLLIAGICTIIEVVIGCIYGGISGYKGGLTDDIMMRIVEIISSMPYLVIVILLSILLGSGIFSLVLAMSLVSWTGTARLVRGKVLQLKEQEFVLAAQTLGSGTSRIVAKHLLPNVFGLVLVNVTFAVPGYIFSEAFLSFIGLGVPSPKTSWGALATEGQAKFLYHPSQLIFPCLFIALVAAGCQLFGDGLTDAMDPRLRQ